jgi:hypothetical protein
VARALEGRCVAGLCLTLTPRGLQEDGMSTAKEDGMPADGELIEAAKKGKVKEMRRLIAAEAKIEEQDSVSDRGGSVSVGRGGWLVRRFIWRGSGEGGGGGKEG